MQYLLVEPKKVQRPVEHFGFFVVSNVEEYFSNSLQLKAHLPIQFELKHYLASGSSDRAMLDRSDTRPNQKYHGLSDIAAVKEREFCRLIESLIMVLQIEKKFLCRMRLVLKTCALRWAGIHLNLIEKF